MLKKTKKILIGVLLFFVIVILIVMINTNLFNQPKSKVFEGIVEIPATSVSPYFEGENCGSTPMLVSSNTDYPVFGWDDGYWLIGICKFNYTTSEFLGKRVFVTGTSGSIEGAYPTKKCTQDDPNCPSLAKRNFKVIYIEKMELQ